MTAAAEPGCCPWHGLAAALVLAGGGHEGSGLFPQCKCTSLGRSEGPVSLSHPCRTGLSPSFPEPPSLPALCIWAAILTSQSLASPEAGHLPLLFCPGAGSKENPWPALPSPGSGPQGPASHCSLAWAPATCDMALGLTASPVFIAPGTEGTKGRAGEVGGGTHPCRCGSCSHHTRCCMAFQI